MPLRIDIPANAVGWYALICPGSFWQSCFINDDYEEVARSVIGTIPRDGRRTGEVIQSFGQIVVNAFRESLDPKIKRLDVRHPTKQRLFQRALLGGATIAYLTNQRFFTLLLVENILKFSPVKATSIKEAQQLVMARPDIQQIERRHVDL